jgi:tetratricopeptide (TPR) repeat protein
MPASPFREIAARAYGLLRSPWLLLWSTILVGGGSALTRLPLLETPGFELSVTMALLLVVSGGAIGILCGRQERNLIVGMGPRPVGAQRAETPLGASFYAAATATLLNMIFIVPPLVFAVAHSALSSRCDPWRGLPFYAVLPGPSAAMTGTLGSFCGLASFRRTWAALLYVFFVAVSATATVQPLLNGPQAFAFNHLGFYFPGPIYDESLSVTGALLAYRAATMLFALVTIAAAGLLLDFKTGVLSRPHLLRPGSFALLIACAAVLVPVERNAFALGFRTTADDLDTALGGRRASKHFVIHYWEGKPKVEVDRLERDLEFRYTQLAQFFTVEPAGPVSAYVYHTAEDKLRLVGASGTNYAKPWRLELHVNDEHFPHATIRHELAHVFCAAFGSPLLKVSARSVVLVNPGIVEGVAMAADNAVDELTMDQWARAMRDIKVAPDIRGIVGPWGFLSESHGRAYVISGSFFRFLVDTYGIDRLKILYPHGDFQTAYGKGLDALAAEWEAFVDKVAIDDTARHLAQVRFEQPSLIARPCAREVSALSEQAGRLVHSDPDRAIALFQRCREIQPAMHGFEREIAEAEYAKHDLVEATRVLDSLLKERDVGPAMRAEATQKLGDIAWELGHTLTAKEYFNTALALHRDRHTDRLLTAKLSTLDDAVLGPPVFSLLIHGPSPGRLLRLREVVEQKPDWGLGWYLIGRNLSTQGDHRRALPYLEHASQNPLPSPDFEVESFSLLAVSRYFAGDCAGMGKAFDALVSKSPTDAFKTIAADWRERCAFEKATYGGAIAEQE